MGTVTAAARVDAGAWTVLVPIQHADRAKTRLDSPPRVSRRDLARALAHDCLTAVRGAAGVQRLVVVSSDPVASTHSGIDQLVRDPGLGLTSAIAAGLAAIGESTGSVAVLLGDLPALTATDLDAGLSACARYDRAFVPDRQGSGTVLLTAGPGMAVRPAFGPGSATAHERLGARRLPLDLPRLRQDVDTVADLRQAQVLGLGPATTAALGGRLGWPDAGDRAHL